MNPQVFGWEHLTYLAVFLVFAVITLTLIKIYAREEKVQNIIVKVVAGILLALIIWNRICICISNQNWTYIIPNSFCGMSSLVLSLTCLIGKKNNAVMHFVCHVAIVGDILTLAYPDFIGQSPSLFYPNTISGLLHHSFGLYLCVLLLMLRFFVPNYKKWPNLIIGFMAYLTVGAFEISVFGYGDAFYINSPILSGTPFTIWIIAPVFAVGYILFFVIYELIKKRNFRKKSINSENTEPNEKSSNMESSDKSIKETPVRNIENDNASSSEIIVKNTNKNSKKYKLKENKK